MDQRPGTMLPGRFSLPALLACGCVAPTRLAAPARATMPECRWVRRDAADTMLRRCMPSSDLHRQGCCLHLDTHASVDGVA
ncbi:hypothetical protein KC887_10620, partial [Candidatus Kaiserbacteria bacterium]|nr:hypothetical protein [Candidatus Kaiserbacteria bacterium]